MGENSKIEWCDHTVNFWHGCAKVSEACDNCYAETLSNRFRPGLWGKNADRWLRIEKAIKEVNRLDKKAEKAGRLDKVFINSMSDFFEDREDLDDARIAAFRAFSQSPNLVFMLLTKRPEAFHRILERILNRCRGMVDFEDACLKTWLSNMKEGWQNVSYTAPEVGIDNVWIGTTVENQKAADKRLPELMKIPAAVRYISVEPMLEEIDLKLSEQKGLNWVICGGESGNKARIMQYAWAAHLQGQCKEENTPFFMKQGSAANWKDYKNFESFPEYLRVREFPA